MAYEAGKSLFYDIAPDVWVQGDADRLRERILQYNNELLRNIPHTREDFIEILTVIDAYNLYCKTHEDYKNNRATHAIKNILRVYDERLEKRDFLQM